MVLNKIISAVIIFTFIFANPGQSVIMSNFALASDNLRPGQITQNPEGLTGLMKAIGRTSDQDTEVRLELYKRIPDFEALAQAVRIEPHTSPNMPSYKVITADIGIEGAFRFYSKAQKCWIIVSNERTSEEIQFEANFHEKFEVSYIDKGYSESHAHILAWAEQILFFSKDRPITPFHLWQIQNADIETLKRIVNEDEQARSVKHKLLEGHFNEREMQIIKAYEAGLRAVVSAVIPTLSAPSGESLDVATPPAVSTPEAATPTVAEPATPRIVPIPNAPAMSNLQPGVNVFLEDSDIQLLTPQVKWFNDGTAVKITITNSNDPNDSLLYILSISPEDRMSFVLSRVVTKAEDAGGTERDFEVDVQVSEARVREFLEQEKELSPLQNWITAARLGRPLNEGEYIKDGLVYRGAPPGSADLLDVVVEEPITNIRAEQEETGLAHLAVEPSVAPTAEAATPAPAKPATPRIAPIPNTLPSSTKITPIFIPSVFSRGIQPKPPSISSTGVGNELQANRNILQGILNIAQDQHKISREEAERRLAEFDQYSKSLSKDIALNVDYLNVFLVNDQLVVVIDGVEVLSTTEEGEQYVSAGLTRGTIYVTRAEFERWLIRGIAAEKIKHEQDEVKYLRQEARKRSLTDRQMGDFLKDPANITEAKEIMARAHNYAVNNVAQLLARPLAKTMTYAGLPETSADLIPKARVIIDEFQAAIGCNPTPTQVRTILEEVYSYNEVYTNLKPEQKDAARKSGFVPKDVKNIAQKAASKAKSGIEFVGSVQDIALGLAQQRKPTASLARIRPDAELLIAPIVMEFLIVLKRAPTLEEVQDILDVTSDDGTKAGEEAEKYVRRLTAKSRGAAGLANEVYTEPIRKAIESNNFVAVKVEKAGIGAPTTIYAGNQNIKYNVALRLTHLTLDNGEVSSGIVPNPAVGRVHGVRVSYFSGALNSLPGLLQWFAQEHTFLFIPNLDAEVAKQAGLTNCAGAHYGVGRKQIYLDSSLLASDKEDELLRQLYHELSERYSVITGLTPEELPIVSSNQPCPQDLQDKINRLAETKHDELISNEGRWRADEMRRHSQSAYMNLEEVETNVNKIKRLIIELRSYTGQPLSYEILGKLGAAVVTLRNDMSGIGYGELFTHNLVEALKDVLTYMHTQSQQVQLPAGPLTAKDIIQACLQRLEGIAHNSGVHPEVAKAAGEAHRETAAVIYAEPANPVGGAITITGAELAPEQHAEINSAIKRDFDNGVAVELMSEELQGLGAQLPRGVKVFVIPSLRDFDDLLVAHPGRGGETFNHRLQQIYFSMAKYAMIRKLSPAAQKQFWAHEVAHLQFPPDMSEKDIQELCPIDLVLAELGGAVVPIVDGPVTRGEAVKPITGMNNFPIAVEPVTPADITTIVPTAETRGTVLVVEDDTALGELLTDILSEDGYNVVRVRNGQEALEILARQNVDLVLSDVRMPGISGIDLAQAIRTSQSGVPQDRRDTPVILITGNPTSVPAHVATELNIAKVLAKPFGTDKLTKAVANALAAVKGKTPKPTPGTDGERALAVTTESGVDGVIIGRAEPSEPSIFMSSAAGHVRGLLTGGRITEASGLTSALDTYVSRLITREDTSEVVGILQTLLPAGTEISVSSTEIRDALSILDQLKLEVKSESDYAQAVQGLDGLRDLNASLVADLLSYKSNLTLEQAIDAYIKVVSEYGSGRYTGVNVSEFINTRDSWQDLFNNKVGPLSAYINLCNTNRRITEASEVQIRECAYVSFPLHYLKKQLETGAVTAEQLDQMYQKAVMSRALTGVQDRKVEIVVSTSALGPVDQGLIRRAVQAMIDGGFTNLSVSFDIPSSSDANVDRVYITDNIDAFSPAPGEYRVVAVNTLTNPSQAVVVHQAIFAGLALMNLTKDEATADNPKAQAALHLYNTIVPLKPGTEDNKLTFGQLTTLVEPTDIKAVKEVLRKTIATLPVPAAMTTDELDRAFEVIVEAVRNI